MDTVAFVFDSLGPGCQSVLIEFSLGNSEFMFFLHSHLQLPIWNKRAFVWSQRWNQRSILRVDGPPFHIGVGVILVLFTLYKMVSTQQLMSRYRLGFDPGASGH